MESPTDSDEREESLRPTVFVGRQRELVELTTGLSEAVGGRGRLFLIVGEPGIGKTRLAAELGDYAVGKGARVLWGRSWEGQGAPPYWPWVQVLRSCLREAEPEAIAEEIGSGAPYVAQIVPELRNWLGAFPPPARALESEHARFRLFDAITTFLTKAAQTTPLVLALDDLHWADRASLLLLQFLTNELHHARILVLGTYREAEARQSRETMDVLALVGRDAHHVPLRGLSEAEVATLIEAIAGRPASAALTRTIRHATEGNPFFVDELARLLTAERRIGSGPETLTAGAYPIPQGVREAIRRRLGACSEECRGMLSVACVVGREFDLPILRQVCDRPAERMLVLLGEVLAAGMVVETSAPLGRFSFSHALVRETLYDDLGPAERAGLHHRIGETLEALYGANSETHLAELAHHFLRAGPAGDRDKAIEYAIRAARRASTLLAHEEAALHYGHALELLERDAEGDGCRADVLLSLGEALNRAGDSAGARRAFQRAAELARRLDDADRLARAALGFGGGGFGGVWAVNRAHDGALVALLEEAERALGSGDGVLRARVLARLATALHYAPTRERRESLSREAVGVAQRTEDVGALAYALAARHYALCGPSDVEERLEITEEILRIAERAGNSELALLGRGWRLVDLLEVGDLSRVGGEIEVYARLADELRQPFHAWYATMWRAMYATASGRLDDAQRLAREALAIGRRSQEGNAAQTFTAQQINIYWLQGRLDDAIAEHERADAEYFPIAGWRYSLALSYAKAGREEEARCELDRAARSGEAALSHGASRLMHPCVEAETAALLGDVARAAPLYELLRPHAHLAVVAGHDAVEWYGSVSHYLGLLAATLGRLDDAASHFRDAIAMHERAGVRPFVARSTCELARVLLERGRAAEREMALSLSSQAFEIARQIGMADLEQKARALKTRAAGMETATGMETAAGKDTAVVEERTSNDAIAAARGDANLFRREGDYWTIAYEGRTFRLRDAMGLRHLAELLRHPGGELHVATLVGLNRREPSPRGTGDAAVLEAPGLGDAGEILDGRAKAEYARRLEDLRDALEEAERFNDPERAARARAEMEIVGRELGSAVGLGGRDRRAASAVERARLNVTLAIKAALKRIAEQSPSLGRHLQVTVRTGKFCSYTPDPRAPIVWSF